MKKLILMTSALTLIGGAAAADIDFGAEASVTYGNWDTGGGAAVFEFGTSLTATFEETMANGVTVGAELTIEDLNTVEQGVIWFSGGFGKFQFGVDEFDAIEDDEGEDSGDIQYAYSMGGLTATVTAEAALGAETTTDTTTGAADATTNDWDLDIDYDGGTYKLGLDTDSTNLTEVSFEVALGQISGGDLSFGGSANTDDEWDVFVATSLSGIGMKLTYDDAGTTGVELDGDAGGVMWAFSWNTLDEIEASVEADMGDVGVKVSYDSTNAGGQGDDAETILELTYGAGDYLDFHLNVNDADEYELGATAKFMF